MLDLAVQCVTVSKTTHGAKKMITFKPNCNFIAADKLAKRLGMTLKTGIIGGKFTVYMER